MSTAAPAIQALQLDTPLGPMLAAGSDEGLHLLEFADRRALPSELGRLPALETVTLEAAAMPLRQTQAQLTEYFGGRRTTFTIPLVTDGTPFERRVWQALLEIPCGQTRSYAQIAAQLEKPGAQRAVGRANGANRIAIIIPCHRVIDSSGKLHGYGGGLPRKRWLLEHEAKMTGAAPTLWDAPGSGVKAG